jgi:2-polyprenyl-3-methyl-5-hydroxy-6-metoxy-1,4-benzoquinol methylase
MNISKVGYYLSNLRKANGMTQDDLATFLTISRQAVSKWETGTSVPDLDMLLKLSELYSVTINDILKANDNTQDSKYESSVKSNKNAWDAKASLWNDFIDVSFDVFEYADKKYENENDLKLLGDVKGKRVLELGCGGAFNGIVLAKHGAIVSGLDLSEEQLIQAKNNAKNQGVLIDLFQGNMENLSCFKSNSFDIVISIMAMMYVEDMHQVFNEVKRVLKPNGIFLYSTCHPIYDAVLDNQFKDENSCKISYYDEWENHFKWKPEDQHEFVEFIRPISSDINALADAGLFIEKFIEFKPIHAMETHNELWTRVPERMMFKARKFN